MYGHERTRAFSMQKTIKLKGDENMQYQIIDVFTDKLFGGNPAGVCLLEKKLPEDYGKRVKIGGRAVKYLSGEIKI